MNILLVIPSLAIGGAEVFVIRLANSLSKKNNVYLFDMYPQSRSPLMLSRIEKQVTLLNFESKLNIFEKIYWKFNYIIAEIFPSLESNILNNRSRYKINGVALFIEKVIQKYNIDVVNSHLSYADLAAYFYFKKQISKSKFVISTHGCYNRIERTTVRKFIKMSKTDQKVFATADSIILLTEKNATPLQGIKLKNEPVFIPLGFTRPTLPDHTHKKDTIFTFVLVSRPEERKGWKQAIDTTIQINEEGTSVKLILVGGSEYQEQLKIQYSKYDYIQFTGSSANVTEWIAQADVGIFASYIESESFPNVVIEYLSCNKPVIATNIGEVANMIKSPNSEFIAGCLLNYNPGGISVSELKDAMYKFLKDETFLINTSAIAQEAFEKFNMDICATKYLEAYIK